MTLTIESPKVYTQQGVPISVTGIAQVIVILIYFLNAKIINTVGVFIFLFCMSR